MIRLSSIDSKTIPESSCHSLSMVLFLRSTFVFVDVASFTVLTLVALPSLFCLICFVQYFLVGFLTIHPHIVPFLSPLVHTCWHILPGLDDVSTFSLFI